MDQNCRVLCKKCWLTAHRGWFAPREEQLPVGFSVSIPGAELSSQEGLQSHQLLQLTLPDPSTLRAGNLTRILPLQVQGLAL